ncbi:MAG: hypothetical protein LC687_07270 [Actinobacteria bacterium]|nr:hypothetical protein [Actinomycetota bacterium]
MQPGPFQQHLQYDKNIACRDYHDASNARLDANERDVIAANMNRRSASKWKRGIALHRKRKADTAFLEEEEEITPKEEDEDDDTAGQDRHW